MSEEKISAQQKHQFKSYYCQACKQRKPCQLLSQQECCPCFYQRESQIAQEYSTYEKTLALKRQEQQATYQELAQLRH
jgi:hypothetical protein